VWRRRAGATEGKRGFTRDDERYLRLAGEVLADQTKHLVDKWILDMCLRPYDREWLDYQHEIGLRYTSLKKNKADGFHSTAYVPLRDILALTAVTNDTIRPFLAAN